MSQALATKYRPSTFEDVCGQKSIIQILKKQIEKQEFKNTYLFAGSSGCGKTTCARIFANCINEGKGVPIEIDGASNNGVENVRQIVKMASERAIDSKYKIIITDECHALSNQAWQAFLKCIEEPPVYTIFIFCTTDPQKIPATILNRVMRFNFTKIGADKIKDRLRYICEQERFINYEESIDYISKICHGGMRDAIALLDKASSYNQDLNIVNVLDSLGNYSYNDFFTLINSLIDCDERAVLDSLNAFYNQGNDLKLFVEQFLKFCLDVDKFALFGTCDVTQLPSGFEEQLKHTVGIQNATGYFGYVIDKLLELKNMVKNDADIYTTIQVIMLKICRCQ